MTDVNIDPDDEFDIDIQDDTPDPDKGKPLLAPELEDLGEPTEDELEKYSKDVQARIKRVTFEKHDQRRKKEEAERQLDEASRLNQAMRRQLAQFEAFSVEQAKSRVTVELADAKKQVAKAFEDGDANALADAQDRLSRLAPQHEQISRYVPRTEEELAQGDLRPQQRAPVQDREAEQRLFKWMEGNKWFQQDDTMTKYAHGVHMQLVMAEPENVGTEEYYDKLSREMRKAFPQKFEANAPRASAGSGVVPVQRSAPAERSGGRKTVKLTETQVKLASRLGLTPKQYAEQLIKEGLI